MARDGAIQLAAFEFDMHAVASLDGSRIANDGGAIRIPADRVSSRKHAEWTEIFQPAGQRGDARVGAVPGRGSRRPEAAVSARQARPHDRDVPPQIACFEPQPQRPERTLTAADLRTSVASQLIGEFRGAASSHRQPRVPPGKSAPAAQRMDAGATPLDACSWRMFWM